MKPGNFFAELKRRNVYKFAVAYIIASWLLLQAASLLLATFEAPPWAMKVCVVAVAFGFPIALVLSWAFEITPEGIVRESEIQTGKSITRRTGRKIVAVTIILAVIAAGLFAFQILRARSTSSSSVTAEIPDKSIAVMPFLNMSDDKANEYFSDGISEELLNLLTKVPQLQVAARTSSFAFKGKQIDIPEIARQLHVAHVLEGSVRKSGDEVRITVQLIRAAEGYHVWSETYDRKLDDIFKTQDEIAGAVVKQLKVTLPGGAAPTVRQTDPQAYALYLQARQLWICSLLLKLFHESDALYRQVLAIDPRYAPAWTGWAANFINERNLALLSNQEAFTRAREAAEKALAIEPDYAPAHVVFGRIATGSNDLVSAGRHFSRARELDSTDLRVLGNAASFLYHLGRLDEALALNEFVIRRDAVNSGAFFNLGNVQLAAGRYDGAIASYRTALRLSPGRGLAHEGIGVALLLKSDAPAALAEFEQETTATWRLMGLALAYHALERKGDCDNALDALIAIDEKNWSYLIACVYAYRGDVGKAFESLDKALAYQDPELGGILTERLLTNIHSDSRWLPFLRKIGRAPEQLAQIKFKVTLPPQ